MHTTSSRGESHLLRPLRKMSRPLRLELANGIYHVFARGNARQQIFLDDRDRRSFLGVARDSLRRFQWTCLTYCLMPNHYHLVLRTEKPNLSRGMRHVNGVYAQRFNRRHGRCGHLFQGRFGATLVESGEHILELIRYVVLNPVRAGLVGRADQWRWSGHAEVLGLAPELLVSTSDLLAFYETQDRYRAFIEQSATWDIATGVPSVIGSREFIDAHLAFEGRSDEFSVRPATGSRPGLELLLETDDLDASIARAYMEHGYRMKEIAAFLGCHYSTVSRRIRRFEARGAPPPSVACKT